MKKLFISILLTLSLFLFPTRAHAQNYDIQFDAESLKRVEAVFQLLKDNPNATEEEKIDMVSGYFKETPYVANRLVGDATTSEQLVIDLNALDCFTYVDYIEAFKRSANVDEFISALRKVRYINGDVTYLNRKHFFSDWYSEKETVVTDVLAGDEFKSVVKTEEVALNQGASGPYIPGLAIRNRNINFIPRDQLTPEFLKTLKTGDYIGLRTSIAGLDVTHCGIIIQKEDGTYMRHASSQKAYRQVIDQKLTDYFDTYKRPTGILVFRSNTTFKKQATPALIQTDAASQETLKKAFDTLKNHVTSTPEEQLNALTEMFLATPYVANRLVGDINTPEQLVIALNELDCFTFVDYIEAFKRSRNEGTYEAFARALTEVRYINGNVTYLNRKHFFSDWVAENEKVATDVLLDPQYKNIVKSEVVNLNQGANGVYIKGLVPKERTINYIPREHLTENVLKTFKTGDYIGLRTSIAGLDVTHCGIIIQKEDGTYMRHASSQKAYRQVIDQKITDYFDVYKRPTGIVVYRPTKNFIQMVPADLDKPNKVDSMSKNDVTVTANTLNENMVLTVTELTQPIALFANEDVKAYDITLTQNGVAVTGEFTVDILKLKDRKVTTVYHVSDDETTKTAVDFTQNDTHVTFKTTHFSKYVVVYEKVATTNTTTNQDTTNKKLPETGTKDYAILAICLLALSIVCTTTKREKR